MDNYDRIGLKKTHLDGIDKFIVLEMDSKLGHPFLQISNAFVERGSGGRPPETKRYLKRKSRV